MKKIFVLMAAISLWCHAAGQEKGDYNWMFGYECGDSTICGISQLVFNEDTMETQIVTSEIFLDITNASISDEDGNLLFYTNGRRIANAEHEIMENGDSLNLEATLGWNVAMPIVQGAMILPCPEQINCYYVFHTNLTTQNEPNGLHLISKILHCTTVDMTYNNGLGKVIEKVTVQV